MIQWDAKWTNALAMCLILATVGCQLWTPTCNGCSNCGLQKPHNISSALAYIFVNHIQGLGQSPEPKHIALPCMHRTREGHWPMHSDVPREVV